MTLAQLRAKLRSRLAERETVPEAMTGTATVAIGVNDDPTKITGTGTQFLSEFTEGAEIKLEGEVREILAISSDTELYVRRPFAAAHAGAAVYRVAMRTWSDDDLTEKLATALRELNDLFWSTAPRFLDATYTVNATAASDALAIPAGLRTVRLLELRPTAAAQYVALSETNLPDLRGAGRAWYLPTVGGTAAKPTAWPARYSFRDANTIELDCLLPATVANGWRLTGPGTIAPWTSDAAALLAPGTASALPDLASIEEILVNWAAADAVLDDETQNPQRSIALRNLGDRRARTLLQQWSVGRRRGTRQVRILGR
jgi:hypothetical protein